jgi:hypothetical protein
MCSILSLALSALVTCRRSTGADTSTPRYHHVTDIKAPVPYQSWQSWLGSLHHRGARAVSLRVLGSLVAIGFGPGVLGPQLSLFFGRKIVFDIEGRSYLLGGLASYHVRDVSTTQIQQRWYIQKVCSQC